MNIPGAPDLVIEILSESTRRTDEIIKRKLYEQYGMIQEYWIIDPEIETVKIYRLNEKRYVCAGELTEERQDQLTTPLLPNWVLPLHTLFHQTLANPKTFPSKKIS